MPQTIRIRPETRRKLETMAKAESTTMTRMLDKMVDAYSRQQLLDAINDDFSRLRRNPREWGHELRERAAWETTLADDLKDDA